MIPLSANLIPTYIYCSCIIGSSVLLALGRILLACPSSQEIETSPERFYGLPTTVGYISHLRICSRPTNHTANIWLVSHDSIIFGPWPATPKKDEPTRALLISRVILPVVVFAGLDRITTRYRLQSTQGRLSQRHTSVKFLKSLAEYRLVYQTS